MNEGFDVILKYLPLLIPILLLQLGLMAYALYDLIKRPSTRGPKWVWVLVIVLGELIGPIIYLVFGRKED